MFNISRLPPPYADRYINYNIKYGCDDSVECFSNCMNGNLLKKDQAFHPHYVIILRVKIVHKLQTDIC